MAKGFEPLAIELEMQKEKASVLRGLGATIERLLGKLETLEAKLGSAKEPERSRLLSEHQSVRAEVQKQRWYMVIQREALGLRNHDDVERIYPLPPPLS